MKKPSNHSYLGICSTLFILLFLLSACSEATDFKDKTPLVKTTDTDRSEFIESIDLNYDSFLDAKLSLEEHIEGLSQVERFSEMSIELNLS